MTKIIGILNITPDSFSDGGKFLDKKLALQQVDKMINDGADIIDIGAESTRPGAETLTHSIEWQRLESILADIIDFAHKNNVEVSLDSYHPENIAKALDLGIDYINDVSAAANETIIALAASSGCKIIINHNLGIPVDKAKIIDPELDIIDCLSNWFDTKILKFKAFGVKDDQIILDVGIGFGKNARQSFEIIERINDLRKINYPIYIGHSRKSFLSEWESSFLANSSIYNQIIAKGDNKDILTNIVTDYLLNKVDFIRVHNVKLAIGARNNLE